MKKYYISLIIKIAIAIAVLAIDLITKQIAASYFAAGGSEITLIPGVISLTFTKNTGAAFGLFGGSTVGLVIVSVFVLLGFIAFDFFYKRNNGWYIAGLSLILGGAIGNMVDRIGLKYVRDFIRFDFINFPVFNLADTFLIAGTICFVIYLIFYELKEGKNG